MRMMLMLNNYFHDMAISIVVVSGLSIFLLLKIIVNNDRDTMQMVLAIYPKIFSLIIWTAIFVIFAGFIRLLNLKTFEWANAVENGQVMALVVKYIMLSIMFIAGSLLCFISHKKIKKMQNR